MNLTEPVLDKKQFLEICGVSNTTFNNWCLRGHVPLKELGCVKVSFTRYKYTFLAAVHCVLLSHHRGNDRKTYLRLLKNFTLGITTDGFFSPDATVAIQNGGKGPDCGIFDTYGDALHHGGNRFIYVGAGQLLNKASDLFEKMLEEQSIKLDGRY